MQPVADHVPNPLDEEACSPCLYQARRAPFLGSMPPPALGAALTAQATMPPATIHRPRPFRLPPPAIPCGGGSVVVAGEQHVGTSHRLPGLLAGVSCGQDELVDTDHFLAHVFWAKMVLDTLASSMTQPAA